MRTIAVAIFAGMLAAVPAGAAVTPRDFGDLAWRQIGPAVMGGRLDVVAGVPGDPLVVYAGHSSGGLYVSRDGAQTFASIFAAGTSTAIGAFAIAPSNPRALYVGTGEGFPRNTASAGDGIFTSTNAGKSWRFSGLRDAGSFARIAVSPRDPRLVLAAALGPEWSPGGERGLYRSVDGGAHWRRVLYRNATTGASDVAFDPRDPRVVYAGTYDFLRRPWNLRSGGTGSGLFKSTDAGATWRRLTDPALHDGLPGGIIDRVAVSICHDVPNVVYALVPTRGGMLYRSTDAGAHWTLRSSDADINFRPFYFSQVRADPHDPRRVYVLSGGNRVSTDGGKTFKPFGGGGDNHDLWIDPRDPSRIYGGSDMGLAISLTRGASWDQVNPLPFAQVYRAGYDLAVPYHVMGGMQDHEVWWGPNELWNGTGVDGGAWRNISDWGDGQYAIADPRDPDVVYENTHFGDVTVRDLRDGGARYISPQPIVTFGTGVGAFRYRFGWSSPLYLSATEPDALYFGGNVLFKTTDRGQKWTAISPDLSQPCDPAWLGPSGGPIRSDNTNAESYCTITSIAQDAKDSRTLWAGTDDGNLQITRDGGATWTELANRIGVPAHSWIASIEASHANAGAAYVAIDRHRSGDETPYLFATSDYGAHWRRIDRGLVGHAHVVREDPRAPQLLFAGTETGTFASFDAGATWSSLQLGDAPVPVYDLAIQPQFDDLIAATHGRGFAILDDVTPLEGLARAKDAPATLFAPRPAWRYQPRPFVETVRNAFVSENKPYGALLSYYLPPSPKKRVAVTFQVLDAKGAVVRTFVENVKPGGIRRTVWDLRVDPPGGARAVQDARGYYVFYLVAIQGPQVLPGTYAIRMTANGTTATQPLEVRLDPESHATAAGLQAQFDALTTLDAQQERCEAILGKIAGLDGQIGAALAKADAPRAALIAYRSRIDALADDLRNGDGSQNSGYKHPAKIVDQIAYQRHIIETYDGPPTDAQRALVDGFARDIPPLESRAIALFGGDLAALNTQMRSTGVVLKAEIARPVRHRRRPAPPPDV